MIDSIWSFTNYGDTLIFLVNVARAFDSIPISSLVNILKDWCLPLNLFLLLQDFQDGRRVVFIDEKTAQPVFIKNQLVGISQGAPLSPILWLITIDEVLIKLENLSNNGQFNSTSWRPFCCADDLYIVFSIFNQDTSLLDEINQVVTATVSFLAELELQISHNKTTFFAIKDDLVNNLTGKVPFQVSNQLKTCGLILTNPFFDDQVDKNIANARAI